MDAEEELITASVSILLLMADIRMIRQTRTAFFSSLYNSQSCCVCSYERMNGLFQWHGRAAIHRAVHRCECLSNLRLHTESMLELISD